MLANDLLRCFLTGEVATEKTDISGTGLWNNVEGRLDTDVLGFLDIAEIADAIPAVRAAAARYVIQAHCVPDCLMIHEASPTSASNLEWFIGTLLPDIAESERFDRAVQDMVPVWSTHAPA